MAKNTAALRSPAAQNLIAAAVTGATVLARPARIPTWLRRSLYVANTAGTAGSLLMSKDDESTGGALGIKPVTGPRNTVASAGSAVALATSGIGLLTSGIGLKLDTKVEDYLRRRGVNHPRWWMAIGAVGLVFVVKTVQDAAAKKAEDAAAKLAAAAQQQEPAGSKVTAGAPSPTQTQVSRSAVAGKTAKPEKPETADKTAKTGKTDKPESADTVADSSQVSSSTPTYDAVRAGFSGEGSTAAGPGSVAAAGAGSAASSDPQTPADAPGAPAAGRAGDSWNEVTDEPAESAGSTDAQPDSVADSDEAGAASLFEQQLAKTEVDDIDQPTPQEHQD